MEMTDRKQCLNCYYYDGRGEHGQCHRYPAQYNPVLRRCALPYTTEEGFCGEHRIGHNGIEARLMSEWDFRYFVDLWNWVKEGDFHEHLVVSGHPQKEIDTFLEVLSEDICRHIVLGTHEETYGKMICDYSNWLYNVKMKEEK